MMNLFENLQMMKESNSKPHLTKVTELMPGMKISPAMWVDHNMIGGVRYDKQLSGINMITKNPVTVSKNDAATITIKSIKNNAWNNYKGIKAHFKFNKSDITVSTNNEKIFVVSNPEIIDDNNINYINNLKFKIKLAKDIKIGDIVPLRIRMGSFYFIKNLNEYSEIIETFKDNSKFEGICLLKVENLNDFIKVYYTRQRKNRPSDGWGSTPEVNYDINDNIDVFVLNDVTNDTIKNEFLAETLVESNDFDIDDLLDAAEEEADDIDYSNAEEDIRMCEEQLEAMSEDMNDPYVDSVCEFIVKNHDFSEEVINEYYDEIKKALIKHAEDTLRNFEFIFSSYLDDDDEDPNDFDDDIISEGIKEQQNNDKLAENAIGIILSGSDDWINDDEYHNFEADYDWVDNDICMLYFRVDGQLIGSWDIDVSEIENINILDDISAEVEAAVSGIEID